MLDEPPIQILSPVGTEGAARTNTNWWHEYCMKCEVRFIRGRPRFGNAPYGIPQPLAIVVFERGRRVKFSTFELRTV